MKETLTAISSLSFILFLIPFTGLSQADADENSSSPIPILTFEEFKPYLQRTDDKIYVINFWATWCAPCVAELPYFEKIGSEYKDRNVEVILVSLDFPRQYEARLIPFVKEHNLNSEVLMLNDPDANSWIPQVSELWTGSIPATLFYNAEKSVFYEKQFDYDELVQIISKFL